MKKEIDLSRTVYQLTEQYPELIELLRDLGFTEIIKPAMRQSAGRIMTIPKGAKMKEIAMERIVAKLQEAGFSLIGEQAPQATDKKIPQIVGLAPERTPAAQRTEQLKDLLRRLGAGEDLESVRADFKRDFSDVEAAEIMKAEQELMKEGTPIEEVQRLCDIHSALFHGATREERIANTEKEVSASLQRQHQSEQLHSMAAQNQDTANRLTTIVGHPLYTFTRENEALAPLIEEAQKQLAAGEIPIDTLQKIREVGIHYAKKGDLLYPLLYTRYDISGPQNVMWTVDDEIRDTLGRLLKTDLHDTQWIADAQAVLKRAAEMIYKEQNILFPICAANFKAEEWYGIYRDSQPYAISLGVAHETWAEAENATQSGHTAATAGEVYFPNGSHLTPAQLNAMLNTMPYEISFVDTADINRYFNEGEKVFMRPQMALDREVFSCHPPKIEPMVRAIIQEFRNGTRNQVPVWTEKNGRTMLVTYMAVRDAQGEYVGTMELVRDMEDAKAHFCGKA